MEGGCIRKKEKKEAVLFFWQTRFPNDPLQFICDGSNTTQAACFPPWDREQLLAHNYVVIHCYLEEKSRGDSERVSPLLLVFLCTLHRLAFHRTATEEASGIATSPVDWDALLSIPAGRSDSDPGDPPRDPPPSQKNWKEKKRGGWIWIEIER